MDKNVKGIIAVAVVGGLGFVAYLILKKKFPQLFNSAISNTTPNDNWNLLQSQSGVMAKVDPLYPQNKEGLVIFNFNGGKNKAQFYYNNSVAIFDNAIKSGSIGIGTYSNGGKDIKIDSGIKKGKISVNAATPVEALMQVIK
tara:strand:+ start:320 stop:745 length:426 start_codon:yes stop_codon:yes gene_type:complete